MTDDDIVEQAVPAHSTRSSVDADQRRWIPQDELRRAPSRWHRPPPAKDWRYTVIAAGRIMLATGLLLFGFVAYQLWGTGIETARAQNALADDFAEATGTTATASTLELAPQLADARTAEVVTTVHTSELDDPARSDAAPVPAVTEAPSDAATVPTPQPAAPLPQPIPAVERDTVLAKLEIPALGKVDGGALYIVPGVTRGDLQQGPGHYPGTPLPGQLGNAAIAGHRTTYGEPFRHIDDLQPGDELILTVTTGQRFVYEVTGQQVVEPDDLWVLGNQEPDVASLTLTSCDPVGTASRRIVVSGALVPERSDPPGPPTLYELPDGATFPTAGPVAPNVAPTSEVISSDAAPATTDLAAAAPAPPLPGPVVADENPAPTSSRSSAAAAADPDDPTVATPTEADAFSAGWFDDRAAFAHLAVWLALLVAVAFAGYWLARTTHRTSIGVVAGLVPFLVALYFTYQNLSRLLPPGL